MTTLLQSQPRTFTAIFEFWQKLCGSAANLRDIALLVMYYPPLRRALIEEILKWIFKEK